MQVHMDKSDRKIIDNKRGSKKKNRQGRRHEDNLAGHGVAHSWAHYPLHPFTMLFLVHAHMLCQRGSRTKQQPTNSGEGGGVASETPSSTVNTYAW